MMLKGKKIWRKTNDIQHLVYLTGSHTFGDSSLQS